MWSYMTPSTRSGPAADVEAHAIAHDLRDFRVYIHVSFLFNQFLFDNRPSNFSDHAYKRRRGRWCHCVLCLLSMLHSVIRRIASLNAPVAFLYSFRGRNGAGHPKARACASGIRKAMQRRWRTRSSGIGIACACRQGGRSWPAGNLSPRRSREGHARCGRRHLPSSSWCSMSSVRASCNKVTIAFISCVDTTRISSLAFLIQLPRGLSLPLFTDSLTQQEAIACRKVLSNKISNIRLETKPVGICHVQKRLFPSAVSNVACYVRFLHATRGSRCHMAWAL